MLPEIVNGVVKLDNSAHEAILKCHTYAEYKLARRRISSFVDPEQNFGRGIHAAMEWRYKKCGHREMTLEEKGAQADVIDRWFERNPMPIEDEYAWQNAARAKEAIGYWNEEFTAEPFEVVATEQGVEAVLGSVRCPVCEGEPEGPRRCSCCEGAGRVLVKWQGRIDGIVRYNGKIMCHDYKTSKYDFDARQELKFRMTGQMRGYAFLSSTLGYGPVRDYWIDSVVIRAPLQKAYKNAKPRNEFHRNQFSVTDAEIEEWRADTLRQIEVWLWECARGAVTRNRTQCSWPKKCSYSDVCELKSEENRLAWLNSGNFRPNDWDPMKVEAEV